MKKLLTERFQELAGIKPLTEHTVNFSVEDMTTLHNDGRLIKLDDKGNEHTYTFGDEDDEYYDDDNYNAWVNDPYLEEQGYEDEFDKG